MLEKNNTLGITKNIPENMVKKTFNFYCNNCGKYGHPYKKCRDPITSYGIINIKLPEEKIEKIIQYKEPRDEMISLNSEGISIDIEFNNTNNLLDFCKYKDSVKFLMIRRKHSLGFIEFIRGRYNVNQIQSLIKIFRQMIQEEIDSIKTSTFDELWKGFWKNHKYRSHNDFKKEYENSKNKFNKLKNANEKANYLNLEYYLTKIKPELKFPEWGFPKGRRNYGEDDFECAKREFIEETKFKLDEILVLKSLNPMTENLIGTNGFNYRHVYYLSINTSERIPYIDDLDECQSAEIGDIGWFTYEEVIKLVRPYHTDRIKIVTNIYTSLLNLIIN